MTSGTAAPSSPDVSIVIVTYNVRALLARCLMSLKDAAVGLVHETFVIDNGSTDGTWDDIAGRADVHPIRGAPSLGFGRANNLAIRLAQGRHVLMLNPDTEMEAGSLRALVRRLDNDKTTGIIGPRLELPNGTLDPAARRSFPGPASAALRLLRFPGVGPFATVRAYNQPDLDPMQEVYVDAVSAACMLVRGDALRAVGGFDPGYFMYGEDLDLAYRIRDAGWRTLYWPHVRVLHRKRQSSRQRDVRTRYEFYRAMWRYYRTHHVGDPLAIRLAVHAAIVLIGAAAVIRRAARAAL